MQAEQISRCIHKAAFLETLSHAGKNCIVCIDGANQSVVDINKKMERVLRENGIGVARGRMTSTMKTQRSFPPRALVISTGEDLPEGHSCRARVLLVDCPNVVHPGADNSLLDELQAKVREGFMNRAMADWGNCSVRRSPFLPNHGMGPGKT